jgi:hypothetical protein
MDHSKMQMAPGTPVMQPGSPVPAAGAPAAASMAGMDHSKMASPPAVKKTKPAAPMAGRDHSKMASGASPKATRAEPAKPPEMDHSKGDKAPPTAGATPSKAAQGTSVLFALRTQPAPPRNGKNDFEVTLKDAEGKPITDAEVSLEFSMPAMQSMTTPVAKLTSTGSGSYKGSATRGMAGDWDVTVKAARNGQQLDLRKMRLTVKYPRRRSRGLLLARA